MSGMLVLSPRQIPIAHEIYSPSEVEIEEAKEIVRLAEEARGDGRSYAIRDGKLLSPSSEKRAVQTLERAAAISRLEQQSSCLPSDVQGAGQASGALA